MVETSSIFNGKRVLITGSTGFKGSWLGLWMSMLGARVHGFALDPPTEPTLFDFVKSGFDSDTRGDISNYDEIQKVVSSVKPDFVFHLAAQPIVLDSYRVPLETFSVNVIGTANLLEAIRQHKVPCHTVVVSSDKCYENREWEFAYRECDPLGGRDVYSASKAATEIATAAWNHSFFEKDSELGELASARGGNVIGGGDFSPARIVPDAMKALAKREILNVRSPQSVRPWQHVLDCLSGYIRLAEWLTEPSASESDLRAFNFGPRMGAHRTVLELLEEVQKSAPIEWSIDSSSASFHEAGRLAVAIDRASTVLGWSPTWGFREAVENTVRWYRVFHESDGPESVLNEMKRQIESFMDDQSSGE